MEPPPAGGGGPAAELGAGHTLAVGRTLKLQLSAEQVGRERVGGTGKWASGAAKRDGMQVTGQMQRETDGDEGRDRDRDWAETGAEGQRDSGCRWAWAVKD